MVKNLAQHAYKRYAYEQNLQYAILFLRFNVWFIYFLDKML